jgi:hypothetical protein
VCSRLRSSLVDADLAPISSTTGHPFRAMIARRRRCRL